MPFGVKSIEKRQNDLTNRLFGEEHGSINATRLVVVDNETGEPQQGVTVDEIFEITKIDRFFLYRLRAVIHSCDRMAVNVHGMIPIQ